MPRIPEDLIREINDASDIVGYISKYVQLKKSGKDYSGLCPFHHEKSPSFHVSADKQLFHCFGCGASGNLVQFVMRTENLDFVDAIKVMADRAGIVIPEDAGESDEMHSIRKNILEMNKVAARFFFACLMDKSKGIKAQQYFTRRGITPSTVKTYGLGYAPPSRTDLLEHFKKNGYSEQQCVRAGLAIERGGHVIDKFRNRVMFPIIDVRGNVIGFGGRIMDDVKEINGYKIPKYLNSSETPVFDKGRNLFSLNLAKGDRRNSIILCEGYMDVISVYQAGITNIVATLGTAITENQAKLMLRYAGEILICYDMDEAGTKAALRAIDIINGVNGKSRVIRLKGAKDPDEYINRYGIEAFKNALKQAVPSTEFKLSLIKGKYDTSETDDKIRFINEAVNALVGISDAVEVDAYIRKISEENEISAEAVYAALRSRTEQEGKKNIPIIRNYKRNVANEDTKVSAGLVEAEKRLLYLIANKKKLYRIAKNEIKPDEFSTEIHKRLAQRIYALYEEESYIDIPMILNEFSENSETASAASAVFYNNEVYNGEKEALYDLIKKIKLEKINIAMRTESDVHKIGELIKEKKYWTEKTWEV